MLDKDRLLEMLTQMIKIRRFEESVYYVYSHGLMPGLAHLYIGEEAVAVGACGCLRKDDCITSTHRGHGHLIAKGADIKRMMAEILGKEAGYCRGKGGSMHIADLGLGILGANGIVGAGIPIATGAALGNKLQRNGRVTLCFFGDGATNTGAFHEGLNLAALWRLPIVYICENNLYGMYTPRAKSQVIKDIAVRADAYGMPGVVVDGNDVTEVYEKVSIAVTAAREGKGPTLIECKTYRWGGHHVGDPGTTYRTKEEVEDWKKKCPIKRLKEIMVEDGMLTEDEYQRIEKEVKKEVNEALEFAKECPFPEPQEALEDLFV